MYAPKTKGTTVRRTKASQRREYTTTVTESYWKRRRRRSPLIVLVFRSLSLFAPLIRPRRSIVQCCPSVRRTNGLRLSRASKQWDVYARPRSSYNVHDDTDGMREWEGVRTLPVNKNVTAVVPVSVRRQNTNRCR